MLAIFLASVCTVSAWGPVSHITFARDAFGATNVDLSACDAPDGYFGFTAPQFSYAPFAADCPNIATFHDPVVAGTIFQHALASGNPDPGYIQFLRSYNSHMLSDFVGFSEYGGYLSNVTSTVNWVTMWPKMQAIDAYIFGSRQLSGFVIPYLNSTIIGWFAADMLTYGKVKFTPAILLQCGNYWIDIQNKLIRYYDTTLIEGDISRSLAFFDTRGGDSSSTVTFLEKNILCAVSAVTEYVSMLTNKVDPTLALNQVASNVKAMFQAGQCG